ncbi:arylsulfatase [Bryobacter aggregatus]|uniref:arylsulfatase n=1 Tax=Bryobacter aggregatus TaxID=360054 RepID=UPI0004E0DCA3|nr:arylsulfatase [Bryobacter aggregatus]
MTRREWLLAAGAGAAFGQRRSRPNLVFILADDLGYGDLGCYGQQKILTPHLDALAKRGVQFDAAYAGSTVCAPSRCCLMTGLHTGHTRVRGNGKNETVLRAGDLVLPEVLQSNGYRTAMFGKWGLGQPGTPGYPTKKGWEEWLGYFTQLQAHNYYPEILEHNDGILELAGNTGSQRKDYAPDVIHGHALRWLDAQNAAKPFFLYYNSTLPHANNEMGRDTGNGMQIPNDAPYGAKPWPQVEKNFAAMVTKLDQYVGSLVAKLEEMKLLDNTLLVFASDNGPHKEGGHDPEFFASRGPLWGIKRDLYEGGIRVPAMAVWANQIPAGRRSTEPWAFWDVMPTFCEAARVPAPEGLDGKSMLLQWQGKGGATHDPFYWEFHEKGFAQAVRQGQWKAVRTMQGDLELYDLSTDLGETKNVAAVHPAVLASLRELMKTMRTESADWPTHG